MAGSLDGPGHMDALLSLWNVGQADVERILGRSPSTSLSSGLLSQSLQCRPWEGRAHCTSVSTYQAKVERDSECESLIANVPQDTHKDGYNSRVDAPQTSETCTTSRGDFPGEIVVTCSSCGFSSAVLLACHWCTRCGAVLEQNLARKCTSSSNCMISDPRSNCCMRSPDAAEDKIYLGILKPVCETSISTESKRVPQKVSSGKGQHFTSKSVRHLLELPTEILFLIFQSLDTKSVVLAGSTCQLLRAVAMSPCLWKQVTFERRRLTHVAIDTLKFRRPQEMAFLYCDFTDIDVDRWQEMATLCSGGLRSLTMIMPQTSFKVSCDLLLHCLLPCQQLQSIKLHWCHATDSSVKVIIDGSTCLRKVDLVGIPTLHPTTVTSLITKHGRRLTNLVLSGAQVNDAAVQLLVGHCTSLCKIGFSLSNTVSASTWESFFSWARRLAEVDLHGCSQASNKAVCNLAHNSPSLNYLDLSRCESVTDEAIQVVATSCKELRCIKLSECTRITSEAVKGLAQNCKKLHSLHISYSQLSKRSAMLLARCCGDTLRELYVDTVYFGQSLPSANLRVILGLLSHQCELLQCFVDGLRFVSAA